MLRADPATGGRFSLRRRFLRLLLAPLLILFGAGGFACYGLALHYANSVYDGWLYDSAGSLAVLVQRTAQGVTLDLPQAAARLIEWDVADLTYYRVSGARSGTIAGRADLPAAPAGAAAYQQARVFDSVIDGRPVRVVALELDSAQFGEPVVVAVAETMTKRHRLASEILLGVLLPQVVLIGAAGLTIWFGIRLGIAPLDTLAARLGAQDPRRPQPIAEDGVPQEVLPLTRALNALLLRLDASLAAQRRFVADSAHQLRTPMTALKINLDQALLETTLEGVRPALTEASRAAERMARLSNQLLWLARAEPDAAAAMPLEDIDLVELAAEIGADWVPRALAKNLELDLVAAPAPVRVRGNRTLLAEVLGNLLDNAVKYHPGGGRISVGVGNGSGPFLSVADDGPGIPPPLRDEVLKRFYRIDRSGTDGSGLGLAIVQEILRSHGGSLTLGDGIGGRGLSVRVELQVLARSTMAWIGAAGA
jgi:two-component system sensor histidine kinase TctE